MIRNSAPQGPSQSPPQVPATSSNVPAHATCARSPPPALPVSPSTIKKFGNTKNGVGYKEENEHIYVGEFKNGLCDGFGIMTIKRTNTVISGIFKDNKLNGFATAKCKDGYIIYEGNYQNNLRHGKGVTYYPNTDKVVSYDGEFNKGKKEGKGVSYYLETKTTQYVGEFKNDLWNGKGTMFSTNQKKKWQGTFVNCSLVGSDCKLYYHNGNIMYSGDIKINAIPHGNGCMHDIDGRIIYKGEMSDGLRHGKGTSFNHDDTIKYSGEWINDKPKNNEVDNDDDDQPIKRRKITPVI